MIERQIVFSQSTGRFAFRIVTDGQPGEMDLIGTGWAGCGIGKNSPEHQTLKYVEGAKDAGPLPRGRYFIGAPKQESTGPYSMRLTPCQGTEMFGRGSFLWHGASKGANYGQESHGCAVSDRATREHGWSLCPSIFVVVE